MKESLVSVLLCTALLIGSMASANQPNLSGDWELLCHAYDPTSNFELAEHRRFLYSKKDMVKAKARRQFSKRGADFLITVNILRQLQCAKYTQHTHKAENCRSVRTLTFALQSNDQDAESGAALFRFFAADGSEIEGWNGPLALHPTDCEYFSDECDAGLLNVGSFESKVDASVDLSSVVMERWDKSSGSPRARVWRDEILLQGMSELESEFAQHCGVDFFHE